MSRRLSQHCLNSCMQYATVALSDRRIPIDFAFPKSTAGT
jgi:hypothetical protein